MAEVIRGEDDTGNEARISAWAVLRYSAIFAAIVVPADFVMREVMREFPAIWLATWIVGGFFGFPAILLATWVVAQRIARRYRRQITARETLQLALASWAWTFIAWCLETAVNAGPLEFVAFPLVWEVIAFVPVWVAYVWLARSVIRRTLGIQSHVEEAGTVSQMLAQQEGRYAEAKARTIMLVFAWPLVGTLGILAVTFFSVIVVLGLMRLKVAEGTFFFVSAVSVSTTIGLSALLAGWWYSSIASLRRSFPATGWCCGCAGSIAPP